jgi:hypothetical protein
VLFQKPAEVPAEQPKPAVPKVDPEPAETPEQIKRKIALQMLREHVFKMDGDDKLEGNLSLAPDPKKAPPPYQSRTGTTPPMRMLLEPGYVVHRRLYFEDRNSERYGWDVGFAQPLLSLGIFYKDVLLYPAKHASNRRERYDTNAGKYMPGSPVPYLLYPPEITLAGYAVGAAAIVGTAFLLK